MWNYRFITEIENMKNINWREQYPDFDELQDIETLAMQKTWCVVRTSNLLPTLFFMQSAWWKIWSIDPDDQDGIEYNILTYHKPKKVLHSTK